MIAATLAGWALQHFADLRDAAILGLVAGLVVAQFIPSRTACRIPPRES